MIKIRDISYILLVAMPAFLFSISCDSASKDWSDAKKQGTVQAFEEFIKLHPTTSYADSAMHVIAYLRYKDAQRENSVRAFEEFIKLYPQTRQADSAKHEIVELNYKAAKEENTFQAYYSFIKSFPESHLSGNAYIDITTLTSHILDSSFQLIVKGNVKVEGDMLFGKVIFDPGYYDKASSLLEQIVLFDTTNAIALNNLAVLKTAKGKYAEALKLLERANRNKDGVKIKDVKLSLWVSNDEVGASSPMGIAQQANGRDTKYKAVHPVKDPPSSSPYSMMYIHYHNQWWARKVQQTDGEYFISPIIMANIGAVEFFIEQKRDN